MKEVLQQQYQKMVEQNDVLLGASSTPPEGWLRTVRKALNMSGAQLARRCGVSRALISQTELSEKTGSVTLRTLEQFAQAMECELVYAIRPKTSIQGIVEKQANKKASDIVARASDHMALEAQSLSDENLRNEILRLRDEMIRKGSRQLWND